MRDIAHIWLAMLSVISVLSVLSVLWVLPEAGRESPLGRQVQGSLAAWLHRQVHVRPGGQGRAKLPFKQAQEEARFEAAIQKLGI